MVWAEMGGGEKPQLKILEQQMEEEIKRIPRDTRWRYERQLKFLGLDTAVEVNTENMFLLLRIDKSLGGLGIPFSSTESLLGTARVEGVIKTTEGFKKFGEGLIEIVEFCKKTNPCYDLHSFLDVILQSTIPELMRNGVTKTPDGPKELIIKTIDSSIKAGFRTYDLFSDYLPIIMRLGLINSEKDAEEYSNEVIKGKLTLESLRILDSKKYSIRSLLKKGLTKSPEELSALTASISKIPYILNTIQYFSEEELLQLQPQNFSAQLVELCTKKIAQHVDFPLEKITQSQKEQMTKLISNLRFIRNNAEIRILIKHGLENTFQQYYDSLEENKKAIQKMKELGINTDVYVYHRGVEEKVYKVTPNSIERLETGKEQINNKFHDVVMQLFANPKGKVFNRPGKVFAEAMQIQDFDAMDFPVGEDRVELLMANTKSDDETWLKGALSVLEKYLKTSGNEGSAVVDEMKEEAKAALFHIQEILSPIKPKKGGELIIVVKMNDKNPLTFLTEGNDSGCCVAFNGVMSWTLPEYASNVTIQAVDISVRKEEKDDRIGQGWLIAGKKLRIPTLIIDSKNVTSAYCDINGIYDAALDYVTDFAEKSAFRSSVMGTRYNDAFHYAEKKFKKVRMKIEMIHSSREIYSDALPEENKKTTNVFLVK